MRVELRRKREQSEFHAKSSIWHFCLARAPLGLQDGSPNFVGGGRMRIVEYKKCKSARRHTSDDIGRRKRDVKNCK